MRFFVFLLTLVILSLALLYVLGDRRQPQSRTITEDIDLSRPEQP